MKVLEVVKERRYKAGYVVRDEYWDSECGNKPTLMTGQAYTPTGDWIGGSKMAYRLCNKMGIAPEKIDPKHCVCSIGYSKKDNKWYGWSHRALYGFTIGSKVKKGHCAYYPEKGEWEAKTMEDAKQIAIDFSKGVS